MKFIRDLWTSECEFYSVKKDSYHLCCRKYYFNTRKNKRPENKIH